LEAVRSAPSPPRIAVGQALPFEGGAPYGPVSALLRELLGLSASAQLDDLNSALEDVGEEVPADDLPDWVPRLETSPPSPGGSVDLEALSVVLGLAEPDPRQDAAARRHRVQAAVQRLVEREARKGPIVLVAGDVHWAPDATLDLVEGLGRFLEDVPVMMVTVARPVLLERRPHFGEGRPDHVRLELGPLDEASCRSLVRAVSSDAGGVDDKTVDLAIARSDGNPLFLEELVKDHLERSGEGEEVPETLQAVLAARLDRCGEEERAALRCAAVVGRTFWQGALEAMGAPAGLSEVLASLRARGLLLRRKPPRIRGEEEYLFKHVLMRDVAYARIPREGRAALHRGAAAWLESLPEGSDQFLDARAEHHEQAGDHLRATDLRARAGDRAAAARSDREAQLHYRAAVGLLAQVSPQPEDHDTRRSGILEQLADSLARTGDYDEALAAYSDARSLVPPAFDQGRSADILRREARVHDSRGEFEEALRVLDEASGSMETGRGDVSLWARLASDRGWVQYRLGDLDGADAAYRGALALLGDGDRGEDRAHLHGLLGSLAYTRGELDEAAAQHRDGLALAEELGNSPAIGRCFNNLGIVAERRGDLDEAAEWHARSVRLKAAGGDRPGLALAYNNLGALYWRRGDLAKSAAAFTASLDLKRRLGNRWGEAITLANLAEVLLDSGDHATCAERIAEAERGCEELGNRTLLPELRRLEAELALARGDRAAAAAKATEAASIARELGDATREGAALRVLGEITGDARTLSEALERSTAAGDRAEADRVKAALQAIDAADGPEAP